MERKQLTCPETGNLEEVEVDETRHGLVIASCSRFTPRRDVQCTRECTRRLERLERRDDHRERVLIVYGDPARTEPTAARLAALLARDGLIVELADADHGSAPPPQDYEAVVIGTARGRWFRTRGIARYLQRHRAALAALPTFLFTLDGDPATRMGRLAERTGWLPKHAAAIDVPRGCARWFADPETLAGSEHELIAFALAIGDAVPGL
jgi:hypothetical protein